MRRPTVSAALAWIALSACASPPPAGAPSAKILKAEEQVQVDRLKLAAVMIRDGHYYHAERELEQVDPGAEGLDRARFHALRGLVGFHRQAHARARDDFKTAIELGNEGPTLQIYLAQAHFALGEWKETLEALDRAGEEARKHSGLFAMRVQSCWRLKDAPRAFGALAEAERRFPEQSDFTRQKLFYLLELGLAREALEAGREYLARAGESATAFLTFGEALRRSRHVDEALAVLEAARLRHPSEERILVTLARAYMDKGLPRAAARLLEEVAAGDPAYASEAAEFHRRGGDLRRALHLNAGLMDEKVKARQRLGLLVEAERYEEAVALEPRLERLGLFEDEDVRFALAIVRFRTGAYDRAEEHLKALTRADLFQASAELRRAIEINRRGLDR